MANLSYKDFVGFESVEDIEKFLRKNKVAKLGEGSSRVVYRISKRRVIKIAHGRAKWVKGDGAAGRAQNKMEVDITNSTDSDLIARVCWYDPGYLWIISEYAEKADNNTRKLWLKMRKQENNPMKMDLSDLIISYQFGMINSRPVVVDYGFNLKLYRQYYC